MKKVITGSIAVALAGGVIIQGVSAADASSVTTLQVTTSHAPSVGTVARGQALFQALYFGVGPAAAEVRTKLNDASYDRLVASVSSLSQQHRRAVLVTTALSRPDPDLFATFDREVTSGDPLRVEAELRLMTGKLLSLSVRDPGSNSATALPDGTMKGDCFAFTVAVAGAAVYLSAAAFQLVVVVAQGGLWVEAALWVNSADVGGLSSEHGIAGVTQALSAG